MSATTTVVGARVPLLASVPTPLQPAVRLSEDLGVEVWFKRDDLTGLAGGGNKVRVLEFVLGSALTNGADTLVTGAGPGSNWAMLAAVGARRMNLDVHLVYYGEDQWTPNRAIAEYVGADVSFTGIAHRASVDTALEQVAHRLRAEGRRPYVVPRGGATPIGALGYLHMAMELHGQCRGRRLEPSTVWVPVGSCGTAAGLVAGTAVASARWRVMGVSTSRDVEECCGRINDLAAGALELQGQGLLPPAPYEVLDGWIGPGYGLASGAGTAAAAHVARLEGVLLDPVFGAKAMAAFLDAAQRGRVRGPAVVVLTGGVTTAIDAITTKETT